MARSGRRNCPVSHADRLQQVHNHLQRHIVPLMPTLLPPMEDAFCHCLVHLMERAREDDSDNLEFSDLVHQAVILAVMSVLSGNTDARLNQNNVRHWTCAFRLNALEENQEDVLAAVIQDEIEAAA